MVRRALCQWCSQPILDCFGGQLFLLCEIYRGLSLRELRKENLRMGMALNLIYTLQHCLMFCDETTLKYEITEVSPSEEKRQRHTMQVGICHRRRSVFVLPVQRHSRLPPVSLPVSCSSSAPVKPCRGTRMLPSTPPSFPAEST